MTILGAASTTAKRGVVGGPRGFTIPLSEQEDKGRAIASRARLRILIRILLGRGVVGWASSAKDPGIPAHPSYNCLWFRDSFFFAPGNVTTMRAGARID